MNFEVSLENRSGVVSARIDGELLHNTEYYFYLVKDGQVISRHGWLSSPTYSWERLEAGRYQVRGFCQQGNVKEAKFSNSVIIDDSNFDVRWAELLVSKKEIPTLLYAPSTFPHQDILVVQGCNAENITLPGLFCTTFAV